MATYAALLRAVNVGGTGKLPMARLRQICEQLGFERAKTYIQTGNVAFRSTLRKSEIKRVLQEAISEELGKPAAVFLRTPRELESIVERNPFSTADPRRVLVLFLDRAAPRSAVRNVVISGREQLRASGRELFIHFPDGMGRSKLQIPLADRGTGRNMNTVAKLAAITRDVASG